MVKTVSPVVFPAVPMVCPSKTDPSARIRYALLIFLNTFEQKKRHHYQSFALKIVSSLTVKIYHFKANVGRGQTIELKKSLSLAVKWRRKK